MDQIERIQQMEQSFNQSVRAVQALFDALDLYTEARPQIAALQEYYQSPQWMQDVNDDCTGKLPATLPRGILSEDGIYNLLIENRELLQELADLLSAQGVNVD